MRVPALRRGRAGNPDPVDPPAQLTNAIEAAERAAISLQRLTSLAAEHERRQLSTDRQTITRKARRLQAKSTALLHAAADRARLDVSELLWHSGPYAHQPWDVSVWSEAYAEPIETAQLVHVAELSLHTPIGVVELPFALPALGSSLVVTHDPNSSARAHHLAQAFVTRALASSPLGSLRVHLIDPGGLGRNLGILSQLPAPLAAGDVRVTNEEISAELTAVRRYIQHLNTNVLLGEEDSLVRRWEDRSAGGFPCSMLLAAGIGADFPPESARQLWSIAKDGPRHGVSVVAVLDNTSLSPPDVPVADLAERIHVDDDGAATWESAPHSLGTSTRLHCPDPPRQRQHYFFTDVLAPAVRRRSSTGGSP